MKEEVIEMTIGHISETELLNGQAYCPFEQVAVYFSQEEWDSLKEEEKELYRDVMMDNYQSLNSMGWIDAIPSIISKIERGEELYVMGHPEDMKLENGLTTPYNGILEEEEELYLEGHEDVKLENGVTSPNNMTDEEPYMEDNEDDMKTENGVMSPYNISVVSQEELYMGDHQEDMEAEIAVTAPPCYMTDERRENLTVRDHQVYPQAGNTVAAPCNMFYLMLEPCPPPVPVIMMPPTLAIMPPPIAAKQLPPAAARQPPPALPAPVSPPLITASEPTVVDQQQSGKIKKNPPGSVLKNSVDELLERPFLTLTEEEKLELRRLGPHQPAVSIVQLSRDRGKMYNRNFNPHLYMTHKWLCASVSKSALFCFPCLLFGGEASWTKYGVRDIKHLPAKIKKHEATFSHIENSLKIGMFGTVDIIPQPSERSLASIGKHNEEVDKNRHVLSKLIDCMRFCSAFELPLHGRDESESSPNRGLLLGFMDFVAVLDGAMQQHLKSATFFRNGSKAVQNELLDCMYEVIKGVIIEQIKEADFVSVQVDEITDVTMVTQFVLVCRYVHKTRVVERFFGFTSLEVSIPEIFTKCVLEQLNIILPNPEDKKKLIAQSYDGASVAHGPSRGVQYHVKSIYPNAHYLHCYAHQLHRITQQAASKISTVRIFFCHLASIAAYFEGSPKRTAVLNEMAARRVQGDAPSCWNFSSQSLTVVLEHRDDLVECFKTIVSRAGEFDTVSVSEAKSYAGLLDGRDFLYFLHLFHEIIPHVDKLHHNLLIKDISVQAIRKAVANFTSGIKEVSESIDDIERKLAALTVHTRCTGKSIPALHEIGKQACDIIITHTNERYEFYKHLVIANLVSVVFSTKDMLRFSADVLPEVMDAYPMLDKEKMHIELGVINKNKEFHSCRGPLDIFSFLMRNNLTESFNETFTLLKILLTTPMTTNEPERCFSTSQRIETFFRSAVPSDRLNALAMLTIEKQLIEEIPDFNKLIIERFSAQKHRQAHFLHAAR
uniref:KRAB domain-containing protein n=1 Tax=Leptobrachium leishanense TaxID=445787 RepID=A0A8C5MYS6_9ANUR